MRTLMTWAWVRWHTESLLRRRVLSLVAALVVSVGLGLALNGEAVRAMSPGEWALNLLVVGAVDGLLILLVIR